MRSVLEEISDKYDVDVFWKGTIKPKDADGNALPEMDFGVYEKGGEIWVNVSKLKKGYGGKEIYQAVANYAYNTGKVFVGDPWGVTVAATIRRTEHMLSSAMKFGTTRHLAPSASQINPSKATVSPSTEGDAYGTAIEPLKWKKGDDIYNMRQLIETSIKNTERQVPEIMDLYYTDPHDLRLLQKERSGNARS